MELKPKYTCYRFDKDEYLDECKRIIADKINDYDFELIPHSTDYGEMFFEFNHMDVDKLADLDNKVYYAFNLNIDDIDDNADLELPRKVAAEIFKDTEYTFDDLFPMFYERSEDDDIVEVWAYA